jgi:hypothetical protein
VRGTVIDGSVDPEKCDDLRVRRDISEAFGRTAPPRIEDEIKKACAKR